VVLTTVSPARGGVHSLKVNRKKRLSKRFQVFERTSSYCHQRIKEVIGVCVVEPPGPLPAVLSAGLRNPVRGAGDLMGRQNDTPSTAFDPAPSALSKVGTTSDVDADILISITVDRRP
jgi:hypothetical protein